MGSFFGSGNAANKGAGGASVNYGRELGPVAAIAPNSGFGKAVENDPVSTFLFGKPYRGPPASAGPWAGVAPSLSAANSGYGLNSTGNPALTGGGASPQLQATFATKPASFAPTPQPAWSGAPGGQNPYVAASRSVM